MTRWDDEPDVLADIAELRRVIRSGMGLVNKLPPLEFVEDNDMVDGAVIVSTADGAVWASARTIKKLKGGSYNE